MFVSAIGSSTANIPPTQPQVGAAHTHQAKDADGDNDGDIVPETQATQTDEDGRGAIINVFA